MNTIDHHRNKAAASPATSAPLVLLSFALSIGSSFAADTPVEVCKKKATTDYRVALRQCELSDRGLRPPVRNCREDAKARYDTALSRCLTVVERKAGGGQKDFLCVAKCPPPPPPPADPKPK